MSGKIIRRVEVEVLLEWDESIGEWMMTPEALRKAEIAKAREMGIILPTEIKNLRARLNLTREEIGELLQVGEKIWNYWENGKYRPSRAISLLIRAVADGEISLEYLRKKSLQSHC